MTAHTIDVRTIHPRDRHPLIFSAFRQLGEGQAMELLNDHDPRPLRAQMESEGPGTFAWEYLQAGPAQWHVRITRTAPSAGASGSHAASCCGGGCGGA